MATHDARRVISDSTIEELADELWMADRKAAPIQPLTARYPDLVIEDAYAIQSHNIERRIKAGAHVIGRKVGLTSKPMQQLLGVDEPDYGVLLDDMVVEDGDLIALSSLVQPRVEAEMAFLMETDLVGPGVTTARALAAIAGVLPSIEVVDSRVADWKIKLVDTVADNASSGLFVMGGSLRKVTELDLPLLGVVVSRNGEVIDTGAGQSRTLCRLAGKQIGNVRCQLARWRHRPAGCCAQDGGRATRRRVPGRLRRNRIGHRTILSGLTHFIERKGGATTFCRGCRVMQACLTRQRRWRYCV